MDSERTKLKEELKINTDQKPLIRSHWSEANDQKPLIRSKWSEANDQKSEDQKWIKEVLGCQHQQVQMVQIKDNHYLPNPYFDERASTMTLLKLDHTSLQGKYSNGLCSKVNTNQATNQRWVSTQSSTTLNVSETARFWRRLLQRLFSHSL